MCCFAVNKNRSGCVEQFNLLVKTISDHTHALRAFHVATVIFHPRANIQYIRVFRFSHLCQIHFFWQLLYGWRIVNVLVRPTMVSIKVAKDIRLLKRILQETISIKIDRDSNHLIGGLYKSQLCLIQWNSIFAP